MRRFGKHRVKRKQNNDTLVTQQDFAKKLRSADHAVEKVRNRPEFSSSKFKENGIVNCEF